MRFPVESTMYRHRWENFDAIKLTKLAKKQLKALGHHNFNELAKYFDGRSPESVKLKMINLGIKIVKMPVPDRRSYTPDKKGVRMEDRLARTVKDPVRASKWVLGERLDLDKMLLDGRPANIKQIVRAANEINVKLGAEQIANKQEWVIE